MDSNSQFGFWNSWTTAGCYENHHRESSSGTFRSGTAGSNESRSTGQSVSFRYHLENGSDETAQKSGVLRTPRTRRSIPLPPAHSRLELRWVLCLFAGAKWIRTAGSDSGTTGRQPKLIEVVVVYKVDRLTRSLADFAKMVEVFDCHGVSGFL